MKNRWKQIDAELFQCFNWDVCYHFGSWHVCTVYGRTLKAGFTSPEPAMQWADNFREI